MGSLVVVVRPLGFEPGTNGDVTRNFDSRTREKESTATDYQLILTSNAII
jgi:hypothetical protein